MADLKPDGTLAWAPVKRPVEKAAKTVDGSHL